MRTLLAAAVRRGLAPLGFELRRLPRQHVWGVDPFADQGELLRGSEVATVFDVGANRGQTTAVYRRLFPAATIHAFEPFPESFKELCQAHVGTPLVQAHRVAVAEKPGRRTFYVNESHYTNSLLPAAEAAGRVIGAGLMGSIGEVEVEAVRLDDFCRERGISRIDILKMDVQGGEGLVLAGAAGLLASRAVRLVFSEVLFAPIYAAQANLWDIHAALDTAGYRIFGLYNIVHMGSEGIAWADVIYLPKGG